MKNYSLCQHWTQVTQNLSIIVLSPNVSTLICHFSIRGVCFFEKSEEKKSIMFSDGNHSFLVFVMHVESLLFEGLIVIMHIFFFLSTHSHTKTSPSVSPRLKKSVPFWQKLSRSGILLKAEALFAWPHFWYFPLTQPPSATCSLPLFSLFTYLDLLFERQGHILDQSPILL